ncbi:MAG: two-component system OmpR family phosphate regulon response regulator PhoB [Elusimicrobia bacterium]|nr:MAG: two-component system OmpR family phosphate regulon response regulator PhoB [Elusimicrobiota bacterium]KAF0154251.1 MAG: two-component system OmpR family phosphate regulon response regulator PhoB [Elusimicrobiota bacterium]
MNAEEKTVLIVDDDSEVWDLLYYIVRKEGFRTEKASDGEEALEKARSMSPSLILLDLMLPKLSGFELLRELQEENTADIPIVLISGRHMDQSTLDLLKREPNVKEFLGKPVKPQTLTAMLHSLLGTRPAGGEG